MRIYFFLFVVVVLLLTSCVAKLTSSIQKTYAPLDYKQEVIVFEIDEEMPVDAEKLGTIKVRDSGLTDSDDLVVIDKAKIEVRKVGGNALKITQYKTPNLWSYYHRITADVFKIENIETYAINLGHLEIDSTLIGVDYAVINVYRPAYIPYGAYINYNLHLGDSIICRVKRNFCESIKIYKDGYNSLWAKTETKTEIPIKVEFGKIYYILCSTSKGIFTARPYLEIVDTKEGKFEFDDIQRSKKYNGQ